LESSLRHAIFTEGAALYRDIREWKLRWKEALQQCNGELSEPRRDGNLAGSRKASSPLHVYYPFLFHTCFTEIPIDAVRELALADRLYTEHLLSYDRILGQQLPIQTTSLFLAHLEHMQSLKRLYSLFSLGHPFWDYFYNCYFETWKNVREEKLFHSHRIGAYSVPRFCAVAKGKTAILKPFSVALAFLSKRTEEMNRLSSSLDQHHIALLLIDDLEDWKQDFQSSSFTFLLTRLIQKTGLTEEIRCGSYVPPERIGRLLCATGLMEDQLRLAEVFFQKASATVAPLPLPLWKCFNNGFRSRCQALRHDVAEIRRREERRVQARKRHKRVSVIPAGEPSSHPAEQQLRAGLSYLLTSQAPQGGFPLSESPHSYMHPSKPLAASRFVTTLIIRSLEPINDLDPSVNDVLYRASNWLDQAQTTGLPPGVPKALEGAFSPMPSGRNELLELDRSFAPTHGPMLDGLRWANLLYICSQKSFNPPRITSFVDDCLLRGDYTPWSHGVCFGPVDSPWTRNVCRPLLPLLLFSQAMGTKLPRTALQDYLLAPYRAAKSWNNTTETSLTLLCLLLVGHDGPEFSPGIEKLEESQELDGSWAPNAIYNEGNVLYGSRELTTAWCLEVLFRYHLRSSVCSEASRTARVSNRRDVAG